MVSEILICGYHSLGNNNELFLEVPVHSDVVPRTNKIKANDLTDNEKKAKKTDTRSCRARQGGAEGFAVRVGGVRASWEGTMIVSMNARCADGQNIKIVRCSTFQGR